MNVHARARKEAYIHARLRANLIVVTVLAIAVFAVVWYSSFQAEARYKDLLITSRHKWQEGYEAGRGDPANDRWFRDRGVYRVRWIDPGTVYGKTNVVGVLQFLGVSPEAPVTTGEEIGKFYEGLPCNLKTGAVYQVFKDFRGRIKYWKKID